MPINIYGGGARTNENGLKFEQETSLADALRDAGYYISPNGIVYLEEQEIGIIGSKHKLYSRILEPNGVYWDDYISKVMYPDEAFWNYGNNTIYIIEKKFQHGSGSVDEKLQTCDFKKKQYCKLFSAMDCETEYIYVCNDWFAQACYDDVHNYIYSVGCHIFFNEIPLEFLNLPLAD